MEGVVIAGLACLLLGYAVGLGVGRWLTTSSLLIGVEREDRTPHKLGRDFYYVVPEREYCRDRAELARARYP